jgi:glycosyltransferase involved in cell wall biosynthesis
MSITLAAMTKNEENCIAGMIQSVRSIVDEVVIVDTGSTDRTLEIVTPLVDGVFYKEFTNFGDLRTYTLRKATKEWILMLDADERILPADLQRLKEMTEQTQYDAWLLPRHQWDNLEMKPNGPGMAGVEARVYPDWQARLFKNRPTMKYVNPVHESLTGYMCRGHLPVEFSPHIQHFAAHFKSSQRIADTYAFYDTLARGKDYGKPTY